MSSHQVEALFCVKPHHDCHLEIATSNRKSDSANRCTFTRRTILPNFIPIWLKTTEPYAFLKTVAVRRTATTVRCEAMCDEFNPLMLLRKSILGDYTLSLDLWVISIGFFSWSLPKLLRGSIPTLRSVGVAHWARAVASAPCVCLTTGIHPTGKVRYVMSSWCNYKKEWKQKASNNHGL